jgi:hypothetical protein
MSEIPGDGMNRRDVLKRGALVGGALVWTVPAVQTLAAPAFAAGSDVNEKLCSFDVQVQIRDSSGHVIGSSCTTFSATAQSCCDALLAALNGGVDGLTHALASDACLNGAAGSSVTVPGPCPQV